MQYELFAEDEWCSPNPFKERVVCALGNFPMQGKVLQKKLLELGADYKLSTKVSRNVHYILLGDGAPKDQLQYMETLKFNGYHPMVLSQPDLQEIFKGNYSPYYVPKEIRKNLHITYEHYQRYKLDYKQEQNPLYTRELYVSPDTDVPHERLFQMLGNRGVYANSYVDENTDVLVVSNATLLALQHGGTNEILRMVEQTYNQSKSQVYRYVMTTEHELLQWLENPI